MSKISKTYKSLTHRPADHPIGYLVAISGALMQMMTYGIDNSFSIFSESMTNDPELGYPSATTVSFGNSVSLGLSPVFGLLAGFMVDRVPPRIMMLLSTALLFAGLWISSTFAKSSVAITMTYCLLASISSACMLSPGAVATGSWFQRRIGLAQGINFCGGGIGSAFIPPILGQWVEMYGWRKTFRLMSAFCSIGLFASIFSCRRHAPDNEEEEEKVEDQGADVADIEAGQGEDEGLPEEALNDGIINEPVEIADVQKNPTGTTESPTSMEPPPIQSSHDALFHALHTRRLTPRETVQVLFTMEFIVNFVQFAVYGMSFYGMIYGAVPYVASMGSPGTVYQDEEEITNAKASTVFTFWGTFQIVGSILVGAMASWSTDAFAYCFCCGLGAISSACLALCRSYAAFAACMSITGFCTAGIFAVMPAIIARYFYGPNLGFFMAAVFVAGCLGGFSAPPIQAQLQTRNNGNYTYGCILISACFTVPGMLCYIFLWPNKQSIIVKLWRKIFCN